jgi:hypothetical protein
MASKSDTQRAAIRERRRQAQVALRAHHQRGEALQRAAFSALDRLAAQLDMAGDWLDKETGDPLQRAAAIASIAGSLRLELAAVRRAAVALVAGTTMTQADVAQLLGTRQALLFPRVRIRRSAPPDWSPAPSAVTRPSP